MNFTRNTERERRKRKKRRRSTFERATAFAQVVTLEGILGAWAEDARSIGVVVDIRLPNGRRVNFDEAIQYLRRTWGTMKVHNVDGLVRVWQKQWLKASHLRSNP